jgi:hypothetical protein
VTRESPVIATEQMPYLIKELEAFGTEPWESLVGLTVREKC